MSWVVNKLVQVGVDLLVKMILKWIADQEAERNRKPKAPLSMKPKEDLQPIQGGWGDKN